MCCHHAFQGVALFGPHSPPERAGQDPTCGRLGGRVEAQEGERGKAAITSSHGISFRHEGTFSTLDGR